MTTIDVNAFEVEMIHPDYDDPNVDYSNIWFAVTLAGVELHRSKHYVHAGPGAEKGAEQEALYLFAKRLKEVLDDDTP